MLFMVQQPLSGEIFKSFGKGGQPYIWDLGDLEFYDGGIDNHLESMIVKNVY